MKRILKISAIVTIAFYLIWSFIAWDILWIKYIGEWKSEDRFLLSIFYPMLLILIVAFIDDNLD